ncbi:Glycoside hydrolase 2 (Mannanase, beta-galactosidase) [Asimina triloba]
MASASAGLDQSHKSHRTRQSGPSARKKEKSDKKKRDISNEKKHNPKAFAFNSSVKAKRLQSRAVEKEQRRLHVPTIDRSTGEPAPFVVVVQGPPKVGKSLLIKCLVKHYTKHNIPEVRGPITVVSGKKRRLQFVECPNDINGMIDAAKCADLALLLIDGSFGFEMHRGIFNCLEIAYEEKKGLQLLVEFHDTSGQVLLETFEFLNIMQNHGFPTVMGVLTKLDTFKDVKKLKKVKKDLKHRFWTELYDGAKLFYLSGLLHGKYPKREILNLSRFISVKKFHPSSWCSSHPYVLADRFEDVTPPEKVHANKKCDRNITLYGYLRGCNIKKGTKETEAVCSQVMMKVHIAGAGDFSLAGMTALVDPCPLPSAAKKKGLRDKEKLFYAPMSGVGDLLYDKDAVYININDHLVQFSKVDDESGVTSIKGKNHDVGEELVKTLQNTKYSIDEKLNQSFIRLFSRKPQTESEDRHDSRHSDLNEDKIHNDSNQHRVNFLNQGQEQIDGTEASYQDEDAEKDLVEESDMENSDEESDDESEGGDGQLKPSSLGLREETELHDGRLRRKAVFANDLADSAPNSRKDSEEDDEESTGSDTSIGSGEDDDDEEDEEMGNASKWKESLIERMVSKPNISLMEHVYGKSDPKSRTTDHEEESSSESEDDEFFKPKGEYKSSSQKSDVEDINAEDCSKFIREQELRDWSNKDLVKSIRDRFVTGDWSKAARRGQETHDNGEEDDAYGDFEDLETGEVYEGHESVNDVKLPYRDDVASEERRLKKLAQQPPDEEIDDDNATKFHSNKTQDDYFDKLKEEIELRKQRNIAELNDLDEATRIEVDGFRTGAYMRLEVHDVPYEMVEHFDPFHPILVGGIGLGEENVGYMKVQLRKHRWLKKAKLKNRDPIIVSIGWRRYETIPVYFTEERSRRLRMLKYTKEHMHCLAMFWGPLATPSTGLVAFQSLSNNQPGFRIIATGHIVEHNHAERIMKKVKMVGYPCKIFKKTAFIKDMFTSDLEIAKFEGAAIQTVSGIRGQVKKAAKEELGNKPKRKGGLQREGIVRCTFEDKILMSDIVFLNTYAPVEVPCYFNPVTTALQPRDRTWKGMKTVAELRRELNLRTPVNKDSLYKVHSPSFCSPLDWITLLACGITADSLTYLVTPVERKPRNFNPLVIPRSLQAALPFASKPKDQPKRKRPLLESRRAVVMEPRERKVHALVQHLQLIRNEKMKKRKLKEEEKKKAYAAEKAKTDQLAKKRQREGRRDRYRAEEKQKRRTRRKVA